MDRWPGDLLARLETPSEGLRDEAVYLLLLPPDEQLHVLRTMDQRLRRPLESAVKHLMEIYTWHFNLRLPSPGLTDAIAKEQLRAVEVARGGRPDEELLLLLAEFETIKAGERVNQLISQAYKRLRKPWKPPALR